MKCPYCQREMNKIVQPVTVGTPIEDTLHVLQFKCPSCDIEKLDPKTLIGWDANGSPVSER